MVMRIKDVPPVLERSVETLTRQVYEQGRSAAGSDVSRTGQVMVAGGV
jgi:hypothetical protein